MADTWICKICDQRIQPGQDWVGNTKVRLHIDCPGRDPDKWVKSIKGRKGKTKDVIKNKKRSS